MTSFFHLVYSLILKLQCAYALYLFTCLFTSLAVEGDCKFQAQLMQYCACEHVFVFVFRVWILPGSRFFTSQ